MFPFFRPEYMDRKTGLSKLRKKYTSCDSVLTNKFLGKIGFNEICTFFLHYNRFGSKQKILINCQSSQKLFNGFGVLYLSYARSLNKKFKWTFFSKVKNGV